MQVDEMRAQWLDKEFDVAHFTVSEEEILAWATACGETEPRFTDPADPDFQAPPTLPSKFVSRRILPEEFPALGRRVFDAGKAVEVHGPIRPGQTLVAHSMIHDIYEKTGRTGTMTFIVHRMEFRSESDELLSVVDWKLVRQSDGQGG